MCLVVTGTELAVLPHVAEHECHHHPHGHTAQQGRDTRAQQPHPGKAPYAVDEHPIARDVHHVAAQQHPHGQACLLYAVEKLLEGVEHHLWQNAHGEHQQVGTHERDEALRKPHLVHAQEECGHGCHQHTSHQGIGRQAVFQFSAYQVAIPLTKQGAHHRGETI